MSEKHKLNIFKKGVMPLFLVLGLTFYSSANTFQDSLENLIINEVDNNKKVKLILNYLNHAGASSKKEVQKYLSLGLDVAKNVGDEFIIQELYSASAKQLTNLGENQSSKEIYLKLDSLFQINGLSYYKGESLLGLAYFDRKSSKVEDAKMKLNQAKKLFNHSNNKIGTINCMNELGMIFLTEGHIDQAVSILDSALAMASIIDKGLATISTHSNLGRVYRQKGEYELARKNYNKALDFAQECNNGRAIAIAYNNLGNIEQITGNMELAMTYYLKSIDIKDKNADYAGMAVGLHNVGTIELKLEDLVEAEKYFKRSLKISNKIENNNLIIENISKLGSISFTKGDFQQAKEYHLECLKKSTDHNYKKGIITAQYYLGKDCAKLKEYSASKSFLFDALEIAKEIKNKPYESAIYVELTQLYLSSKNDGKLDEIGLDAQQIENFLLKGNDLAVEMNNLESKLEALKGLSSFYMDKEDFRKSTNYFYQLKNLSDSVYTANVLETTKELKIQYETVKKENQILKLEKEKELSSLKLKNSKIVFSTIVILLIIFGFTGYQYIINKSNLRQLAQKEALRKSISRDLHDDVGSILSSISLFSLIAKKKISSNNIEAKNYLERINDYAANSLESMNDIVWALKSDNDKLQDVLNRMRSFASELSDVSEIKTKFEYDESILNHQFNMLQKRNIYLIFKEAINNAFKYSEASEIIVSLRKNENNFSLIISDNGKGFSMDEITTKSTLSGNGMSNMKSRAVQINGILEVNSELEKGTTIRFNWE